MNRALTRFVRIALCATACCICSMIRVPTPIPFTLALFAVYFSLFFLGPKDGFFSTLLFLSLGFLGLPIFSAGSALSTLLSPLGGYLVGMPLLCLVFWFVKGKRSDAKAEWISAALALLSCYVSGATWYWLYTATSVWIALCMGVFPFVAVDFLKIFLARLFSRRLKSALKDL